MLSPLDQYVVLLFGIFVTLISGRISILLCQKNKIIDYPGRTSHAIHSVPQPLGGGIAIAISLAVLLFLFRSEFNNEITKIIIPALIIFIFGLIDDKKGLSASLKFLGQLLGTILIIISGIRVQIFENATFFIPILSTWAYWLDIFITLVWIIGITNAFNLTDSMDGVALGLAIIASAFFLLACISSNQSQLAIFSAMLLGIGFGLSVYNFYPARMFLGDSGAQLLGFILSIIGIWYTPIVSVDQNSSWFVPILILGIPIFDTCLVFISRIIKRSPFYAASLDHTYHRLIATGLPISRAIYLIHFVAILLGWIGISLLYLPPLTANALFLLCILIGGGIIAYIELKLKNIPRS